MFALVADVEAYPQFVPLCTAMVVQSREREGDQEIVLARMTVAYGILHESFTSRIVLDPGALSVNVQAIDGPFRRMENAWLFEPADEDTCLIHFSIDYEFRSRTLGFVFGAMFDRAFRRFSTAFENRADALFGRGAPAMPA
jgi:coenzyme Q-binding protein COQ10